MKQAKVLLQHFTENELKGLKMEIDLIVDIENDAFDFPNLALFYEKITTELENYRIKKAMEDWKKSMTELKMRNLFDD